MKGIAIGNKNILRSNWFGIIFLIIVPLIYVPIVLDPALMPRFAVFSLAVAIFTGILFFLNPKNKQDNDFRIMLSLPVLLLMAYWIIAGVSILVAINKSEALSVWITFFPFIAFVMLGSKLFSSDEDLLKAVLKYIIVFALFHTLIGIIQFLSLSSSVGLSHELSYYVKGLSAHRNLFAQSLFLSIPFLLYGIYSMRGLWRWLAVIASALSLAMVTILLVKSVWMALIISVVFTLLVVFNYSAYFGFNRKSFRIFLVSILIFIGVIAISVFIYSRLDSWKTIDKQADWIRNYRFGSSLERLDLWNKSVDIYRDNIFLGVGTGNWKIVLPAYGTDGLRSEEGIVMFTRPHNDYLGVLSENGIFGFVFYIGFFFTLIYYMYRLMKKNIDKSEKTLLIFLFSGLVGYMVIAMLSFPGERVEHSVFLGLYASYIIALYNKHFSGKGHFNFQPNYLFKLIFIIIPFLSFAAGISKSKSEFHMKKALNYRDKNQNEHVVSEIDKADNFLYCIDNTAMPLAWYKASAHFHLGNIELALEEYLRAHDFHPNNMHVLNNLGTCYTLQGEQEKAIELYNKALVISSGFEDAYLNLIAVYYNQGNIKKAVSGLNSIDPQSENPKYLRSRKLVLKKYLQLILDNLEEGDVKYSVERIADSEEWISKVYQQSLQEGVDFDRRILNEAIYLMEVVDSTITPAKASDLKAKYLGGK